MIKYYYEFIICKRSGQKRWLRNGKWHREDGPAIEYSSGSKEWWIHGKRHRMGGPAIQYRDGTKEWWINNKFIMRRER